MRKLKNYIKKLRLRKNDILVAHPALQEQLLNTKMPSFDFDVPIIFTPEVRNIQAIPKDKLRKVLENIEKGKK